MIFPPNLHKRVLELLDESHLGVVKMKALARSHVRWQGIDKALEPLKPYLFLATVNFAGPFQGQM